MTLQLDPRRLAMLREMGLQWVPPAAATPISPSPAAVATVEQRAPVHAAPPVIAAPVPVARTATRPDVAGLGWEQLANAVAGCTACGLCQSRRATVFGVGPQRADWMVIGDPPAEPEDLQGEPFVGDPGKLLDNMLRAAGLDRRRNVHLTNVLKCRPPGGRNPEPQELAECDAFLRRQVALVQPRMILAMGRFAVQSLLQTQEPIGRLRGRVHRYQDVPVVVTYHPAYLLRNLPDKAKAWADLCLAMDLVERGS